MKKLSFLIIVFILFVNKVSAIESLWYYTETPRSRTSLFKNIKKINILAPQVYELGTDATVTSTMKDDVLNLAKNNHVKVMPLLANTNGKTFNQKTVLNLLDNPDNWEKISKYMREQAYNNNFIGWQLDLENIPVSEKDNFTNFVKYLKGEFDKDSLKLSIAVVSKISDNKKDYDAIPIPNYWDNWAGAYDYKALASTTDFLSIMAYDQPDSTGPVATVQWSKKVLDYTLKTIPQSKISFGIPVYAWAYRGTEKKHFLMVDYSFVYSIITNFAKNDPRNMTTGAGVSKIWGNTPWVSYNKGGKNYTIWYEDKNSFKAKLDQIKKYSPNAHSFSVWVLGDEDPKVWEVY